MDNRFARRSAGAGDFGKGKKMTHKELMNEADMLQGNINRMMVTKDNTELITMYAFALERLSKIYRERTYVLWEIERETDIPK